MLIDISSEFCLLQPTDVSSCHWLARRQARPVMTSLGGSSRHVTKGWAPKATASANGLAALTRPPMSVQVLGETPDPVPFDDFQVLPELLRLLRRQGRELRLEVATAPFGELGRLAKVVPALLLPLVVVAHQQPPREGKVQHLAEQGLQDGQHVSEK
jgi:hypothetical protein